MRNRFKIHERNLNATATHCYLMVRGRGVSNDSGALTGSQMGKEFLWAQF